MSQLGLSYTCSCLVAELLRSPSQWPFGNRNGSLISFWTRIRPTDSFHYMLWRQKSWGKIKVKRTFLLQQKRSFAGKVFALRPTTSQPCKNSRSFTRVESSQLFNFVIRLLLLPSSIKGSRICSLGTSDKVKVVLSQPSRTPLNDGLCQLKQRDAFHSLLEWLQPQSVPGYHLLFKLSSQGNSE